MPSFRLDDFACIYQAPTAIPHESAPTGGVFRPFRDEEAAREYADLVCNWFATNNCPQPVFVVRGPTSTTKFPFEVVDASAGYSISYRVDPPESATKLESIRDVTIASDARLPRLDQVVLHSLVLRELLTSKGTMVDLVSLCIARCQAFQDRGIPPLSNEVEVTLAHRSDANSAGDVTIPLGFLAFEWAPAHEAELAKLFRSYIKTGVIDPNAAADTLDGFVVSSPVSLLDWATRRSLVVPMGVLIEEGADSSFADQGDLIVYINAIGSHRRDEMLAAARTSLMRRAITDACDSISTAPGAVNPVAAKTEHFRTRRSTL